MSPQCIISSLSVATCSATFCRELLIIFRVMLFQSVCIFSPHLHIIWSLALCFAESCWLFFAQGHGGKSHEKRNYIIAYLEATRFHGSHPSNVWGVFGAHKERWFCKHCIVSGRFRWANQVQCANAHLSNKMDNGQQVTEIDQTGKLCFLQGALG